MIYKYGESLTYFCDCEKMKAVLSRGCCHAGYHDNDHNNRVKVERILRHPESNGYIKRECPH